MPGRSRSATACSSGLAPMRRCFFTRCAAGRRSPAFRSASPQRRARRRHRRADLPPERPLFQHGDHRRRRTDPHLFRHLDPGRRGDRPAGPGDGPRLVGPDLPQRNSVLLHLPRGTRPAAVLTFAVERRRFGFYSRAIKASERAARSLGVPVRLTKLSAGAVRGIYIAAGSLYAARPASSIPIAASAFWSRCRW